MCTIALLLRPKITPWQRSDMCSGTFQKVKYDEVRDPSAIIEIRVPLNLLRGGMGLKDPANGEPRLINQRTPFREGAMPEGCDPLTLITS